jgi:hypothetical protein
MQPHAHNILTHVVDVDDDHKTFGKLGLWAPSSGGRDVFTSIAYVFQPLGYGSPPKRADTCQKYARNMQKNNRNPENFKK